MDKIQNLLKTAWVCVWCVPAGVCMILMVVFVVMAYGFEEAREILRGLFE